MKLEAVLQNDDVAAQSRATARSSLRLTVRSNSPAAGERRVVLHNISRTGLLIEAPEGALATGDALLIDVPEDGAVESRVVWESGRFFGCKFHTTISQAAMSGALLQAEPRSADVEPLVSTAGEGHARKDKLAPEVSFAIPLLMAFILWGLIGAGVYLFLR